MAQKRPPTVRRSRQGKDRIGWDLKGNCSYSENARYKKVLGRYFTYVRPSSHNSTRRKVHMTQTPVN